MVPSRAKVICGQPTPRMAVDVGLWVRAIRTFTHTFGQR